jgi:tripartite-type tricarboxylate transporter receptor subunit TctC
MKCSVAALAALTAALMLTEAQAQQYPQRAVSLVVPFPPGAATDAFARLVADRMTKILGQQMVVINRDGAAGLIGTESVARAAPDGYTLVWGTSSGLAIMPALGRKMPFDCIRPCPQKR